MSTYLYRAVAVEYTHDLDSDELVYWPGLSLGRMSGYLSRSSAVDAGVAAGVAFEIVRSEPVVFLTRAEKIQKQINDLHAELVALEVAS